MTKATCGNCRWWGRVWCQRFPKPIEKGIYDTCGEHRPKVKEEKIHGGEPATGISISQDQLNQKDLLIQELKQNSGFWGKSADYWRRTAFEKQDKIDQLKKENECLAQTVRDQEEQRVSLKAVIKKQKEREKEIKDERDRAIQSAKDLRERNQQQADTIRYNRAKEDLISAEELLEDRQRIIDRQRKLIGKHQSILKADLSQAQEGWVNQPVEESYDQRKRAVVYQKKDKDDTNIPVWVIPKEVK